MSGVSDEVTGGDEELAPGTVVAERYRVEELIGAGGMARVYRVFDLELERTLAMKVLSGLRASPDFVRRFRREVSLALRITHPNVIRLFDLGAAEVRFLTMEWIDGASLRSHARSGPLALPEAAEIVRQAALGLAAAHEAGVVHRDLKPENILIASGGRVVVCDFGVAGESEAGGSQASAIVGTSAYMAPEQANGEPATPQADLYALGLVLYELLTGEVPLVGSGAVATALRREKEVAPPLRERRPEVPPAVETLVARLLSAEPRFRPASALAVAAALEPHATPLSRTLTPAPVVPEAPTRIIAPTRRWWLLAAALPMVLAAAAVVWWQPWRPAVPTVAVTIDPAREILFSVAEGTPLPTDLAFLSLPAAAHRALAYQLPDRVAAPGSRVDGAVPVSPSLARTPNGFRATLAGAGHEASGVGATPADALDAAADGFVRSALPAGAAPTARERADAQAWGASSPDLVRRYRRALVACGRLRHDRCIALARKLEEARFLRPLVLEVTIVGDDGVVPDDLRERARAASAVAAPDARLLAAALAGSSPETRLALPEDPGDVWQRYLRAWALAYQGKFDEAFAVADHIAERPDHAGIGLWLAYLFARFYVDSREHEVARAMTERIAEEPRSWIELARVQVGHEDLEGAAESLRRAQAVGGSPSEVADVEAQLALASFDLEHAGHLGRRLLASESAADRLAGQQTLYAVDVLTGNFEQARRRMPGVITAYGLARDYHSPTDALELGQDAFVRGDLAIAEDFLGAVVAAGERLRDIEYVVSAKTKRAAMRHVAGQTSAAELAALIQEQIAELTARGFEATSREYAIMTETLVAIGQRRCDQIKRHARAIATPRPVVTIALARCDLDAGDPARALARLGPIFEGHGRRNYPTISVIRELLLGRAFAALGNAPAARAHLEQVVRLWRDAPDTGEVAEAQRLLQELR